MGNKNITSFWVYTASILLMGIYLLSYIGFSVHKCTCEGSTQVSVLIGFPSCDNLHTHIHITEGEHRHCEHNHHEGCCDTEILVLTTDQTNSDQQGLYIALSSVAVAFNHYPVLTKLELVSELLLKEADDGSNHTRQTLSQLSVWRL